MVGPLAPSAQLRCKPVTNPNRPLTNPNTAVRPMPVSPPDPEILLAWYDRHARVLPWRVSPQARLAGALPDPYRVWLSEIMLQQTTVVTVGPYFRRFIERWPTVEALAAAPRDAVLTEWAGLGYYARARNLHACAQAVAADYGGVFPDTEEGLRALPGIGAYTAAAVAAIAFDRRAGVVDGNVERVMARLYGVAEPLPGAKAQLKSLAAALTPAHRSGDYAQAVMDLGATVCTPRQPKCLMCPWQDSCVAQHAGNAADLPRRAPRPERPQRYGVAYWATRPDGAILLQQRPDKGLLGGMIGVPTSAWLDTAPDATVQAPFAAGWRLLPGVVQHGFTHFRLDLTVAVAQVADAPLTDPSLVDPLWVLPDALGGHALPTLMRKVVRHAFANTGRG
jgi:A/G-specific adenine glycosylase